MSNACLTFEIARIRQQELLREAAQFSLAEQFPRRQYGRAWWSWIAESLAILRWSPRHAA